MCSARSTPQSSGGARRREERDTQRLSWLKPSLVYFALVFGAGFVLGMIRVPFLAPRLGERYAELLEMPFMLVAIVLAARFVVRRYPAVHAASASLVVGAVALAVLLVAEWQLGLWLQGRSFAESWAQRDPVSGSVYALMLLVFALMPYFAWRRSRRTE